MSYSIVNQFLNNICAMGMRSGEKIFVKITISIIIFNFKIYA